MKSISIGLISCLLCISNALAGEIIFQSATGPFNSTSCCGSHINNTQYIGVTFTLDQTTHIDGIGGHFRNFAGFGGSIFGAVVSLGNDGLPTGTLGNVGNVISYTVFTPNSGQDTVSSLNATLTAGTYGLVFGSGMFGANGSSTLTLLQPGQAHTTNGDVFALNTSSHLEWTSTDDAPNRYRMFVTASEIAVPLPAAFWLFSSAVAGLFCRRRARGLVPL